MLATGTSKYSKKGALMRGRALGFKRFIKMCEVEQIKAFALENPSLYYDILPYAYVFGLSDVWMKKFEGLDVVLPEWITSEKSAIDGEFVFRTIYLRAAIRMNRSIDRSIAAHTGITVGGSGGSGSSGGFSGGGSFGGGGFSGGGSGGGGFGAR